MLLTPLYNTCASTCLHGFYIEDEECLPCDSECATCSGPAQSECTSCERGMLFTPSLGSCSPQCPTPHFFEFSGQCLHCTSECASCFERTSDDCLECADGFAMIEGTNTCIASCPSSYFRNATKCEPCASSCSECTGPGLQDCSLCDSYHYFYQGGCEVCPASIDQLQSD